VNQQFVEMKFFAALSALCITLATGTSFAPKSGPAANHEPWKDVSVKFMSKKGHRHSHKGHKAGQQPADETTRNLQFEVENMVDRVHQLHDPDTTAQFAKELGSVEASLSVKGKGDANLMNEIGAVRAQLCVEAGFDRLEFDDCKDCMDYQCSPPVQHPAKASAPKSVVPAGFCTSFFAETNGKVGEPPAAAPAASPAGSPGAAPGPEGAEVLEDKLDRPLQEQGVSGPLVQHVDMETHTSDWRQEFGPDAGHRSFRAICADHPDNEWCRLHGYYQTETPESGAIQRTVCGAAAAMVLGALAVQW